MSKEIWKQIHCCDPAAVRHVTNFQPHKLNYVSTLQQQTYLVMQQQTYLVMQQQTYLVMQQQTYMVMLRAI